MPASSTQPDHRLDAPDAAVSVIRGGAWRTIGFAVASLLALISLPLLVRHLGVVDLGRYQYVVALTAVVGMVSEAGLTGLGVREYAVRDAAGRRALLDALVALRLTFTAIGVVLATGFAVATGMDAVLVAGVVITGVAVLLQAMSGSYAVVLSGQLRFGWVAAVDVVRQLGLVAAIAVLVIVDAPLVWFFVAPLVANLADLLMVMVATRGKVPLIPGRGAREWRGLLRHVLPFTFATAAGIIYLRISLLVMPAVATDEEVGLFAVAMRLFEQLGAVAWLLVNSAFPILARAASTDRARLQGGLQKLSDVAILVGGGAAVATIAGAPLIIRVIAGEGFDGAIGPMRLLGVALFWTFLMATGSFALLSLKRHRALLVANITALATGAVVTLVLAGPLGANGAAIGSLSAEVVVACGYAIAIRRGERDLRLSPRILGPVALACGLAAVPAILLPGLVLPAVGAVLAYGAVILLSRSVPPEIWHAVRPRS
jgi:O-antigen/teichoic acid export membrane protein